MRLAIILAPLVAIANAGSPEFDMINNVPDRTVVRFSVDLAIYCGEYGASQPFQCDIQLREWNRWIDEKITRKITVKHNNLAPLELDLKGEMYWYTEPGNSFEPYIRLYCMCGKKGDKYTPKFYGDYYLTECEKEKKVCFYDEVINILEIK